MTQQAFVRQALELLTEQPTPTLVQLPLPFYGETIDVDGMQDPKCDQITYWGKAVCVFDNVYRCYANVWGTMAIVEITVTRLP